MFIIIITIKQLIKILLSSSLQLHITESINWCVLQSIEVWGQLSASCSRSTVRGINSLFDNGGDESSPRPEHENYSSAVPGQGHAKSIRIPRHEPIYEQAFCPINGRRFNMPMLLPSRNCIDVYSLRGMNERNRLQGRGGYDPFTGIPFNP